MLQCDLLGQSGPSPTSPSTPPAPLRPIPPFCKRSWRALLPHYMREEARQLVDTYLHLRLLQQAGHAHANAV